MTPEQRRIKAEILASEGSGAWVFRVALGAELNALVADSGPEVDLFQSRTRPGLWFALQCIPDDRWAAGPAAFEDVVEDVVEYLLEETVLADGPRLALLRAEAAERKAVRGW